MNRGVWLLGFAGAAVVLPALGSPAIKAAIKRATAPARGETAPLEGDTPPNLRQWRSMFFNSAARHGLDVKLLFAISLQESRNSDPKATRQEPVPAWIQDSRVLDSARAAGWTNQQLSTSYGLMQVLGATAWGLGYRGKPSGLLEAKTGIEYGARCFAGFVGKYKKQDKSPYLALLAYNGGGSVVRDVLNGTTNKRTMAATAYAAAVLNRYKQIKAGNFGAALEG